MNCSKCGHDKDATEFRWTRSRGYVYLNKICIECSNARERLRCNKGVRNKNKELTKQMIEDKSKGLTFGQIARKYKLDNGNIQKRIRKYHERKNSSANSNEIR